MGFKYTEGIYKILWERNPVEGMTNYFWGAQKMFYKETNVYLGLQG